MKILEGFEKKYLRGLAHGLKPVVFIGRQGMTENRQHHDPEKQRIFLPKRSG
jgi:hypothetical protein